MNARAPRLKDSVGKAARDAQEAMMSRDAALSWAVAWHRDHGRWPTRRFRVEAGGIKRRLLGHAAAWNAQRRYGGKVAELIPARSTYLETIGWKRPQPTRDAARELGPCPWCGAGQGEPCVTPTGHRRMPHAKRLKDAHKQKAS